MFGAWEASHEWHVRIDRCPDMQRHGEDNANQNAVLHTKQ